MFSNLKKRISTSILMLILLFLMFINNYLLGYFTFLIALFSLIEFFKINLILFKKDKAKQLISNIIFIIYIFSFFGLFLFLSLFPNLKILIFIILLICIASDIGGFIIGRIFKGPKLTKISPQKTISGSLGSIFLSAITAIALIYYLTKTFNPHALIIAIVISITCQIGDLFFSYLKRKSFLKDTGNFLPGHGGILDRIDGIIFGLPIGFLTLVMIY